MSSHMTEAPAGQSPTADTDPPADVRQAWRFGPVALVFMLVCGLLAGVAIGVLALAPRPPADDSPEAGFAREMMIHHGQAVSMGLIAHRNATDSHVRTLGLDIALAQQTEIGMMRQWLREWHLHPTGTGPPMAWMEDGDRFIAQDGLMPGMATAEQMTALREAEGVEVDRIFLELMINHHLGGIHMIDGILELSDHPEVTHLAGQMKDKHHREMVVLRNLQDKLADATD
jgi:uncharacterized protein (DUF305 family)